MSKKLTDAKWTLEEVEILQKFGNSKTCVELSELIPNHSLTGISAKIKRLKIKDNKKWTEEELTILQQYCDSIKDLKLLLPGRTQKGILKARIRYGFGKKLKDGKDWTEEEIAIVQTHGSEMLSTELVNLIPNHTEDAIADKCHKMRISKTKECRIRLAKYAQSCQPPDLLCKLDQSFTIDDLNNITFQILLGSILGDGCCSKAHGKYKFCEGHGWKQKDYVIWKQEKLSKFSPIYMESSNPVISTPNHKIFAELREKIYEDKSAKNRIPLDIISRIDYLGLLIWYLDDGHLGRPKSGLKYNGSPRRTYPHITAKGYNTDDLFNACDIINFKLDMNSYLRFHKQRDSFNKIIVFNKDKDWLFTIWCELAKELSIPQCMHYKLNNFQPEHVRLSDNVTDINFGD
jgi:LAGLIDADG DNA endonuclease family